MNAYASGKQAHWLWRLYRTMNSQLPEELAFEYLKLSQEKIKKLTSEAQKACEVHNGGRYGPWEPARPELLTQLQKMERERRQVQRVINKHAESATC